MAGDDVGEVGVGHVEHDAISPMQRIDVAERRQVGGAMPSDRGRAGDAREVGFGKHAGALLQFGDAGAVDEHVGNTEAGNVDGADGPAPGSMVLELAGEESDALALGG